jgi:uncharacterized protein YgiM (DUF1202 family)
MNLKSRMLLITLLVVLVGSAVLSGVVMAQQAQFAAPIMVVNVSFLNVRSGPGAYYSIITTVVGGTELPVLGVASDGVWYQVSTLIGNGWVNSEHAVGRGDFTHIPVVEAPPVDMSFLDGSVPADVAALGQGGGVAAPASTGGNGGWGLSVVTPHGGIIGDINSGWTTWLDANGVFYPIIGESGLGNIRFYLINTDWAGNVWADSTKILLRPYGCTLTTVSFPSDVLLGPGPDGSGTDGFLPAGWETVLINEVEGHYFVEMYDGTAGWTFADDVMIRAAGTYPELCSGVAAMPASGGATAAGTTAGTTAPVPRSPGWVVVNTGHLNIRSGPGAQYTIVGTVAGGTELDVTGFAPDGVWYRVRGDFGEGWLNIEFAVFRGDGRYIPVIRGITGFLATPKAMITNAVTLYAAPNSTMGVIGTVSGPLEVNAVARTDAFDWVQLETSIGFGWVMTNAVTISGDAALIPVVGN